MLIEPTESESFEELERLVALHTGLILINIRISNPLTRFCQAMVHIREEVDQIVAGKQPKDNNVLKNAPHPISTIALPDDKWDRYGNPFSFFSFFPIRDFYQLRVSSFHRPYTRED